MDGTPLLAITGNGGNTVESLTLDNQYRSGPAFRGDANLFDVSVTEDPNNPFGDPGVALTSGSIEACDVFGATGSAVASGPSPGRTVEISDCFLESTAGITTSGVTDISRVIVLATDLGIHANGGTTTIEDAEIDISDDTEGSAVSAVPNIDPVSVVANHLTVVGDVPIATGERHSAFYAATAFGRSASLDIRNSAVQSNLIAARCNPENDANRPRMTFSYTAAPDADLTDCSGDSAVTSGRPAAEDGDFMYASAGDFRLPADSPLVDRGTPGGLDAGESPFDVLGQARIYGNARDLGAHEYNPPPPAGPRPPGPKPSTPAMPSLTELAVSARRFRAARRGATVSRRAKVGTRIIYRLNVTSDVSFRVERQLPGRRSGAACRRPTRRNRRGKACRRYVLAGGFRHKGSAGRNSLRFTGRIRGRKLVPGRYRLVAAPAGSAAKRSARFVVVR